MTIYFKSVRLLMRDYVTDQRITKGQVIRKRDIISWFREKYPRIKESTINAHLILMSVNARSRIHFNVHATGEDDLFYQMDPAHFRLYDVSADPRPIYSDVDQPPSTGRSNVPTAYEYRDIQDFSLPDIDIAQNINDYVNGDNKTAGIQPFERYASFDYCFNYFQGFRERNKLNDLLSAENIEKSCLHLGFYLASWGMFRRALLLSKSLKVYEAVIDSIVHADAALWEIDANCYTPSNVRLLLAFGNALARSLDYGNGPSDTLITKIMLGVFGNVPAFDYYVKAGLDVSIYGKHSLDKIARFYEANSTAIEEARRPTLDFLTGQPTDRRYTRAKVIDMIFFIEGGKRSPRER